MWQRDINLTPEQAAHPPTVFIEPLKKQPPEGYEFYRIQGESALFRHPVIGERIHIDLRFPVGTKVGLRETFHYDEWEKIYYYYADAGEDYDSPDIDWHSSVTMPNTAIRHWRTVTANRVCRVQGICAMDIIATGSIERSCLDDEHDRVIDETARFEDWYNTRFSRRKGFKPWSENPYVEVVTVEVVG